MNERIAKRDIVLALRSMVDAFQPFTMRPMGAPGSQVRIEQDAQILSHANAREVLKFCDEEPA